jgi:hypothetical protein
MSEATEIFDTDNEDENTDDGSGPQSMGSVCLSYPACHGVALTPILPAGR